MQFRERPKFPKVNPFGKVMLIFTLIVYLFFAFVSGIYNPGDWNITGRFAFSSIELVGGIIIGVIYG